MPKKQTETAPTDDETLDESTETAAEVKDDASPESEVQADDVQPEVEAPPSFLSRLGDEFSNLDEETAARTIQERLSFLPELQRREAYYQSQLHEMQRRMTEREQQEQQVAQAKQAAEKARTYKDWKAPEYSRDWLAMVERDKESGRLLPLSGADPMLPSKLQAFAAHRDEVMNRLAQDPDGFLAERLFESKTRERFEQMIEERLAAREQQASAYQRDSQTVDWERAHSQILYDQHGQVTSVGKRIIDYANQLGGRAGGVQALDHATKIVYGELALEQAKKPSGQAQNDKQKTDFLRRGAETKRNRDGTFARSETQRKPQNQHLDIHERLKANFAEAGYDESAVFN